MYESSSPSPTVAAVVVTRDRTGMLRQTLQAIKASTYPISEIIVSDDSSGAESAEMLAAEFPEVIRIQGPRRGISSNRNCGLAVATSDYILLSDDDMLVAPTFVELAIKEAMQTGTEFVFTGTSNHGHVIFPNNLDILGFTTKAYRQNEPYRTANQQCFLISRAMASRFPYDECIEAYGHEEMDYAYRVTAAGFRIGCISSLTNIHLAPDQPFRVHQDASRLYVGFKRSAYIDRSPLRAAIFLAVAMPNHLVASVRRFGLAGISVALSNFLLAARMLTKYRRSLGANRLLSRS